jgi:hypothetical protein
VKLYQQWKLFKQHEHAGAKGFRMSASTLDDLLHFLEQRKQIRSELDDAWMAWEKRQANRGKAVSKDVTTASPEGTQPNSLTKIQSLKEFQAAAAFLSKTPPLQEAERPKEVLSGKTFDPIQIGFRTLPSAKASTNKETLGPSAMVALRQNYGKAAPHHSAAAVSSSGGESLRHPGLQIPAEQTGPILGTAPASSLAAAIAHRAPLSAYEIDVAQLHALCLYFVLDHTPCASLEYVPPYAAKITEVKPSSISGMSAGNTESTGADVSQQTTTSATEKSESQQMRVTLRISRSSSSADVFGELGSLVSFANTSPKSPYTRPSYLFGLDEALAPNADMSRSGGLTSLSEDALAPTSKRGSRASLLKKLTPGAQHPGAANEVVGIHASPGSAKIPLSRNTIRPGMVSSPVDDELLENEYNSLLQRLQDDEKQAVLEEQGKKAAAAAEAAALLAGMQKKRRGSFEEGDEDESEEEEELPEPVAPVPVVPQRNVSIPATRNTHVLANTATKLGGPRQSIAQKISARSNSKSPTRSTGLVVPSGNNSNSSSKRSQTMANQRLSIKGLYATKDEGAGKSKDDASKNPPASMVAPTTSNSGKSGGPPIANKQVSGSGNATFGRQISLTSIVEANDGPVSVESATASLMNRLSSAGGSFRDNNATGTGPAGGGGGFGRLNSQGQGTGRSFVSRTASGMDAWTGDPSSGANSPAPSNSATSSANASPNRMGNNYVETAAVAGAGSNSLLSQRALDSLNFGQNRNSGYNAASASRPSWTAAGQPPQFPGVSEESGPPRELRPSEIVSRSRANSSAANTSTRPNSFYGSGLIVASPETSTNINTNANAAPAGNINSNPNSGVNSAAASPAVGNENRKSITSPPTRATMVNKGRLGMPMYASAKI